MKRGISVALYTATAIVMIAATGCPSTGGTGVDPVLSVIPAAFNFGPNKDDDSFAIQNAGTGVLIWNVSGLADWLDVTPDNGSTPVGGPTVVDISVDRTGLDPGLYSDEFLIASNGGSRTVSVSMRVSEDPLPPTLQINPAGLDFGTTDTVEELDVENAGEGTVTWTLEESIPWLTTSLANGATSATPTTVVVTVNRTGMSPGAYTDNIEFTSDGGDITLPVSMTVPGPTPLLGINPTALDFETNTAQLQFTVRNTGTGTLNWTITESIPWLSLDVSTGTTTSETETITATVDRGALAAKDYSGTLAITSNGGAANISVDMTVAPAELVVTPTTLNFGKFATDKLIIISNGGTGTVNWSISTAGLPGWLSLAAPTSGSVAGDSDAVIVSVNRIGQIPGQYSFTFQVTSDAGNENVTVNMTVAEVPVLTIDTGFVNPNNNALAPLGDEETTFDFTITNTGTGTLNWNIDPADFPLWLSMTPVAGDVQGAQIDTVTITVSRALLSAGGFSALIPVTSNGGNKTIEVTMQVPLRPVIGVLPTNLDFGLNADSSAVSVANVGDPGTVLNFLVVTDRDWLFVSPQTGTSIGTASVIKDYQTINVSIDRSELESTGATGTITVYALDALGEINPDIAPETITVSVEATELSFQTALVRTRIPSLLRYSMVMRDIQDESFVMDPALLTNAFRIFEDGIQIEEPSETTQQVYLQNSIVTEPLSDLRIDLRMRTVLLLDYSGSMVDAAEAAGTDLQSLYELAGSQFIDDYFDYFANTERGFATIAIMEFHDRNAPATLVLDFTDNPTALKTALQNIFIEDNGASAILPAVAAAGSRLVNEDFPHIGFDDADVRSVALLSDGRLTTPPGEIQDYVDVLVSQRVRLVPIGWGTEVNHEPLARLASGTGGHYYLTKPDGDGNPVVANLANRVEDLNLDLASHTVLSYVSLGEEENVPIRFDGALNDPNDSPDQGIIQGISDEQNVSLSSFTGDILMGQVSMRTTGVQSGATQATVRADYIPRNVNKFEFTLSSTEAFTVSIVPLNEGGLVEGWTLTPLGGGVYSLIAPTPAEVLPYGSYGDLLRLSFASVGVTPFILELTVDNTIYSGDTEPKYFIYPDTMTVGADPFLAPAFPTPDVSPSLIALGTATNSTTIDIRNIGGTYPYVVSPEVLLTWQAGDLPSFVLSVTPDNGMLLNTTEVDTAQILVNRALDPGTYSGTLMIDYFGGTLDIEGSWPIVMSITILPPVLGTVNTANLAFGSVPQGGGNVFADFQVTNTGQSTLDWAFVTNALPVWIESVLPASGSTVGGELETVTVTIDPTTVAPGVYSTNITLLSDGGNTTIPVSVTITP
ncbi:MAG: VWA domain-containing protein [Candidatus Hydrogenedentes bacterium]|nr:VWA domain-containing protein [Candidatus Hydrogenedentota bacterium]